MAAMTFYMVIGTDAQEEISENLMDAFEGRELQEQQVLTSLLNETGL